MRRRDRDGRDGGHRHDGTAGQHDVTAERTRGRHPLFPVVEADHPVQLGEFAVDLDLILLRVPQEHGVRRGHVRLVIVLVGNGA